MKARGYRMDRGSGGAAAAWWILTEDPRPKLAWLNAQIYDNPSRNHADPDAGLTPLLGARLGRLAV